MSTTLLAGSLFLMGIGGVVTWIGKHRRKKDPLAQETISVLASQALGPKNRLVLVTAGQRTLLLCVGDKGTSVLARWRGGEDAQERLPAPQRSIGGTGESEEAVARAAARRSWKEILEEEEISMNAAVSKTMAAPGTASEESFESPLVAGLAAMRQRTRSTVRGAYGAI